MSFQGGNLEEHGGGTVPAGLALWSDWALGSLTISDNNDNRHKAEDKESE